MAQTSTFDGHMVEGQIKKNRPDSGIHNSTELNGDQDHNNSQLHHEPKHSNEELVDSGQESDQVDTSVNSSGKKKGFLNNFKKMFKKKKSSPKPDKPEKTKEKNKKLKDQTKASSEPDVLADGGDVSGGKHQMRRTITESSFSPKRPKPPRTFTAKGSRPEPQNDRENEDESNFEKKGSLKDGAQQYIRSSLRKLKGKRSKEDSGVNGEEGEENTPSLEGNVSHRSNVGSAGEDNSNMSLDDEFFTKTLAAGGNGGEKESTVSKSASFKLIDIETTTPRIQTDAAKDRIRIAPQNRRKPSRYRTGSGNGLSSKSTRTSSIHSFNNDPGLSKIDEDKDNFTSVSRNSSSIGQRTSNFSRQESQNSNQNSSRESLTDSRKLSDPTVSKIIKTHSFKSDDDSNESGKIRTIAQRSLSSNSRENINRPKPPMKPPRSTHTSTSSLHKEDMIPSRGLSLGSLNGDYFYTEENKTKDRQESYGAAFSFSSSMNNENTPLNEVDQNVPPRANRHSNSSINDGGVIRSSRERLSKISNEDVRGTSSDDVSTNAVEEMLRRSKEDLSSRGGAGETFSSRSIQDILGRNPVDTSRSNEELSKRNSRENVFRLSREDISRRSKEDISRRSKEDISHCSREDVSKETNQNTNRSQELIFPKTDDKYGMMAFALTSPPPPVEPEEEPVFYRTKSCSEKTTYKDSNSDEHLNNDFRERSHTSGANSHGHEVGRMTSPPPTKQKPSFSPRKLRRPTSPDKNSDNKSTTPEFHRVSLKKVPKLDDYLPSGGEGQKSQYEVRDPIDSVPTENEVTKTKLTMNVTTTATDEKETVPSKPFKTPDLRSADMYHHSTTKTLELKTNASNESSNIKANLESNRSEFLNKRNSLKKIELPKDFLEKTPEDCSTDPVLQTTTSYTTPELKRASWKSTGDKSPTESGPTPLSLKRNSLKKIDRSSYDGSDQNFVSIEQTTTKSSASGVKKFDETSPPRPLVKGRPTVHGKTSFKFQSNDVLPRSKSVSGNEARKLRSPTSDEEKKPGEEPEWFKLARSKQKDKEDEEGDQKMVGKPAPPPTKPKVSPRPVVSPKPVVSPRPNQVKSPPTAPKNFKRDSIPIAPAPTRTSRSFNANMNITRNECLVCNKTAYTFEKVEVNGRTLHQNCAKCEQCARKLNAGDIFIQYDKVYCSQHK